MFLYIFVPVPGCDCGININITANTFLIETLKKRLAKAKANNVKNPAMNRLRRKVVGVFGKAKSSKRTA